MTAGLLVTEHPRPDPLESWARGVGCPRARRSCRLLSPALALDRSPIELGGSVAVVARGILRATVAFPKGLVNGGQVCAKGGWPVVVFETLGPPGNADPALDGTWITPKAKSSKWTMTAVGRSSPEKSSPAASRDSSGQVGLGGYELTFPSFLAFRQTQSVCEAPEIRSRRSEPPRNIRCGGRPT